MWGYWLVGGWLWISLDTAVGFARWHGWGAVIVPHMWGVRVGFTSRVLGMAFYTLV